MVPVWVPIRVILGLYWGMMEKKMETTIMGYIGIIGFLPMCCGASGGSGGRAVAAAHVVVLLVVVGTAVLEGAGAGDLR